MAHVDDLAPGAAIGFRTALPRPYQEARNRLDRTLGGREADAHRTLPGEGVETFEAER